MCQARLRAFASHRWQRQVGIAVEVEDQMGLDVHHFRAVSEHVEALWADLAQALAHTTGVMREAA